LKKVFPLQEYCIGRYDVLIEKNTGNLEFIELNANTPGLITDISDISSEFLPD
jgi:glutathionylspermidine synthase